MPTLKEQIASAKAAGYSDDDIAKHLSARPDLAPKIAQATAAGYKPDQIIAHLGASAPTAANKKPESSLLGDIGQGVGNLAAGALRGAGSIGATLLAPIDAGARALNGGKPVTVGNVEVLGQDRRKAMDGGLGEMGAEPDSFMFGTGKLASEIAGTLGAGGLVANGAVRAAPALAATSTGGKIISAIASGGMKTGAPAAATLAGKAADLGIRSLGAGVTGGASTALIEPEHTGTGTLVSAALPGTLKAAGGAASYLGGAAKAFVQPLTTKGQEQFAANILRKAAEGGPLAVNTQEFVRGSTPTLAEATGNAGIAGLQRVARDLRPNAFVEREAKNAGARTALFDGVAGDRNAIELAVQSRGQVGDALYGKAFTSDAMRQDLAKSAQAARAPFSGVGLSGARDDLATPGLRELASRPMFRQATEEAKRLAANNGVELADPLQSLQGLHYIKLALDDALNPAAKSAMGRNASGAVMDMRSKLENELAKVSPQYGTARTAFSEMSKPINAMESLQGLKLRDARGNITLAKVQNALDGLEKLRNAPGVSNAKSVADDQMQALMSIRDDLLRQDKLGLGRSVGANTFQNLAVNNMLSSLLPGALGNAARGKIGTVVEQGGKLFYSGADAKIRNNLVDMLLDPQFAQQALSRAGGGGQNLNYLRDLLEPVAYRSAPALSTRQ
jgi:hypothetical protein